MSVVLASSVGSVMLYTSIPKEEVNVANVFLSRQNGKQQVCFSSFPIGISPCNVQALHCLAVMAMARYCTLKTLKVFARIYV